MRKFASLVAFRAGMLGLVLCAARAAASDGTEASRQLLRYPTLSQTHIVFNYAGDLWIVSREGGDARASSPPA